MVEISERVNVLRAERDALRAALETVLDGVQLHVYSMNDVAELGRFSAAVDPVRLVTGWRDGLKALLTQASTTGGTV